MKKFYTSLLLLAIALMTLASCGGKTEIRDDVAVTALAEEVEKHIAGKSNLSPVDDDYLMFGMDADLDKLGDYIVKTPESNSSIDEYGIFKAENEEQLEYIKKLIDDYIAYRIEVWDPRYLEQEKPKVEGAKSKVVGNYVVYVMLSASERDAALDAFEKLLTK